MGAIRAAIRNAVRPAIRTAIRDADSFTMFTPSYYFKMDGASGANETDEVAGITLTQANTVGTTTGKVGSARTFSMASNRYMTTPDTSIWRTGTDSFLFACWVYFTADGANQAVCGKGQAIPFEWLLFRAASNDKLSVNIYTSNGASSNVAEWATAPTINTWYHVVCGYRSSDNKVFINVNNGTEVTTTKTVTVTVGAEPVDFGRSAGSYLLTGYLDECVWYKGEATAEQLEYLYNSGNGRTYSTAGGWV